MYPKSENQLTCHICFQNDELLEVREEIEKLEEEIVELQEVEVVKQPLFEEKEIEKKKIDEDIERVRQEILGHHEHQDKLKDQERKLNNVRSLMIN